MMPKPTMCAFLVSKAAEGKVCAHPMHPDRCWKRPENRHFWLLVHRLLCAWTKWTTVYEEQKSPLMCQF